MRSVKILAPVIGILLLASPVFAQSIDAQIAALLAQIKALQAQITTLQTQNISQPNDYGNGDTRSGMYCPKLSITMQKGARDVTTSGQVSELQAFLTDYFDLDENIVVGGYFGNLTRSYVIKFQNQHGLPSFGIAGSMTRTKIAKVCKTGSTPSPIPVNPTPSCTPLSSETRTQQCPAGQTGTITQVRISSCPGPVWNNWQTTANTCQTVTTRPASCTFNGQTIASGASVTAYQSSSVSFGSQCMSEQRVCANGTLSGSYAYAQCATAAPTFLGTPTGEKIDRYYPFHVQRGGLLVSQSDIEQRVSQWADRLVSPTRIDVTWGDPNNWPGPDSSTEEFELKSNCAAGRGFLWLNAFKNENINQRYPIETTKAEIKISNGSWIDITQGGTCGTQGQPYALAELISEPYTLRVWGNIYTINGTVGRRFFWQHTISHEAASTNACWHNDPIKTRSAIVQEEAWWDSTFGWMSSGANTGAGSMGANGEPDGSSVAYVRGQKIAKDVGPGWSTFGGINYCIKYLWDW